MIAILVAAGAAFWVAGVVRDSADPVHLWSQQVRTGSVEERREAAAELASFEGADGLSAIPALVGALADPDETVAVMATRSLGQVARNAQKAGHAEPVKSSIDALSTALHDPRDEVRVWAALGLASADPALLGDGPAASCSKSLTATLADPAGGVRQAAATALGEVGLGDEGLEALAKVLADDPFPGARAAAALSLGRYRSDANRPTLLLLRSLRTADGVVRDSCEAGLFTLASDPKNRRTAAIVPDLIAALDDPERRVRVQAAGVLGEIGPEAVESVPALIGLLQAPLDPESPGRSHFPGRAGDVGGQAALALGEIAPSTSRAKDASEALVSVLRDGESDFRRANAALALSRFGPEVATPLVPLLLESLRRSLKEPENRADAYCVALGRVAPASPLADEAVTALIAALELNWPGTKEEAARALGEFGPRARPALDRLRKVDGSINLTLHRAVREAIRKIEPAPGSGGVD